MSLAVGESKVGNSKRSWLPKIWGARFAIAVTGTIVFWWLSIILINGRTISRGQTLNQILWQMAPFFLVQLISLFFTFWTVFLFFTGLNRLGKLGNVLVILLGIPFCVFVANALFNDWFGPEHNTWLRWLFWAVPIAAILLYPLPIMRMKRKAVGLVMEGDYEQALRISKKWLRSSVYGRPFQGWILLEAGRYNEAKTHLRDAAFDGQGKPQLTNVSLYYYVVALMSEDKYSEAQELLEAAIRVPQKGEHLRLALVDCLLSQNIEASRACEMVERIITTLEKRPKSDSQPTFMAECMAFHALALACCGRSNEAEARLQEALSGSTGFTKRDLAVLQQIAGRIKQALGDTKGAKAAFEGVIALHPHGDINLCARRKLLELAGKPEA